MNYDDYYNQTPQKAIMQFGMTMFVVKYTRKKLKHKHSLWFEFEVTVTVNYTPVIAKKKIETQTPTIIWTPNQIK